jgi:hypothetical protein
MPGVDIVDALVVLWNKLEAGAPDAELYPISEAVTSMISLLTNLDAFLVIEKYIMVKRGVLKNGIVRGPVAFHLDEETRLEVDRRFDRVMAAIGK